MTDHASRRDAAYQGPEVIDLQAEIRRELARAQADHFARMWLTGDAEVGEHDEGAVPLRGLSPIQNVVRQMDAAAIDEARVRRLFDIPSEIDLTPPPRRRGDHYTFDRRASITAPATEAGESWWREIIRRLTNSGGTA